MLWYLVRQHRQRGDRVQVSVSEKGRGNQNAVAKCALVFASQHGAAAGLRRAVMVAEACAQMAYV